MPSRKALEQLVVERMNDTIITDYRNFIVDYHEDWKIRQETMKLLYGGKWEVVYPNETSIVGKPKVMNLVQVGMDDLSRLVNEVKPQVKVKPLSQKRKDVDSAFLKVKAYETYWLANKGPRIVPNFALDLEGSGFAAFSVYADREISKHPILTRLDPYACFPTIENETLLDLVVRSKMKAMHAERLLHTKLNFHPTADVEVIEYYDDLQIVRFVAERNALGGIDTAVETDRRIHELDFVPVAWTRLPTYDGTYRGIFDQVGDTLLAQNRILQLMLDYSQQQVYSPWRYKDVENPDDPPGPNTKYHLLTDNALMERIPPAGSSPMLLDMLQFLDDAVRGGTAYPRSRQGTIPQSIASASFVSATLGQLATTVKAIQGCIGDMRQMGNEYAAKIDKKFLNFEKPLLLSSDETKQYNPETLFADEDFNNSVLYGAGAGLDAVNKKLALLQDVQAKLVSRKTAMEQIDYLGDVKAEIDQINAEMFQEVFGQKSALGADMLLLTNIINLFGQGKSLEDIAGILAQFIEEQQAQQAQAAQAATAPTGAPPGPAPTAPPAAEAQQALEKGSVGPVPVGPVEAPKANTFGEYLSRPAG